MNILSTGLYRRSFFFKYILSYIIIILLLLGTISIVVDQQMISSLEDKMRESNEKSLRQMADSMEAHFLNLQYISNSISLNSRLVPSFYTQVGYSSYEGAKELTRYMESYNTLSDLWLYYPSTGTILTPTGLHDAGFLLGRAYESEVWDPESFGSFCRGLDAPVVSAFSKASCFDLEAGDLVLYIHPVPIHNKRPNGYVIFLIEYTQMAAMLETANVGGESVVYVTDGAAAPLLCVYGEDNAHYRRELSEQLSAADGRDNIIPIREESFYIFEEQSAVSGLQYFVATPFSKYMSPITDVKNVFRMALVLIALVGGGCSLALVLRNYMPLRRLADSLSQIPVQPPAAAAGSPEKKPGELEWIRIGLDNMKDTLRSKQAIERQQLLLRLLHQRSSPGEDLIGPLAQMNVDTRQPRVLVIAVEGEKQEGYSAAAVKACMCSALEELCAPLGSGYCVDAPEETVFYLLLCGGEQLEPSAVEGLLREFRARMAASINPGFATGVGEIRQGISQANTSFVQAVQSLNYKSLKGGGQDIFYRDVPPEWGHTLRFLTDYCALLEEGLRAGDIANTLQVLADAAAEVGAKCSSPTLIPYFSYSFYLSILNITTQYQLDTAIATRVEEALQEQPMSFAALLECLRTACTAVCQSLNQRRESKSSGLHQRIVQFVGEHYADKNLTLEQVAEEFGFSASYLTRHFKAQTGLPLMKYIDGVRMEHAKELLRTGKDPVEAIVEACGYVDKDNFYRKFKRQEGATPLQYRKLYAPGPQESLQELPAAP